MTETQERFLRTILAQVPLDTVVELHLFPPIRRGTLETGVAVVVTELPPPAPVWLEPADAAVALEAEDSDTSAPESGDSAVSAEETDDSAPSAAYDADVDEAGAEESGDSAPIAAEGELKTARPPPRTTTRRTPTSRISPTRRRPSMASAEDVDRTDDEAAPIPRRHRLGV